MKAADDENNPGHERNCANCNYFFPYLLHGPSEYGICLNDPAFEPYIDELLESENYDSCKGLIEEKKYDGNEHSCEDFEMIEIIGTDSSVDEPSDIDPEDEKNLSEVISFFLKTGPLKNIVKCFRPGIMKKGSKLLNPYPHWCLWTMIKPANCSLVLSKRSLHQSHLKTFILNSKFSDL